MPMIRVTTLAPLASVLLLMTAVPIFLLTLVVGTGAAPAPGLCGTGGMPGGEQVGDTWLDAEQMQVATEAVRAVRAFRVTADKPHAAVIVLATGYQESSLRNLDYGDRDSLGFLQQRPSQGWGTPTQVRDVTYATTTFLRHLVQVPGWETRRVTDVAADVQRPADQYRDLYQQWVGLATGLVQRLWGTSGSTISVSATSPATGSQPATVRPHHANLYAGERSELRLGADVLDAPTSVAAPADNTCDQTMFAVAGGAVVYPLPATLAWSNRNNWGGHGAHWDSWHTGTDFSVPCGTPVLASHAGTIEIDTTQNWAGPWLLKVTLGPGRLTTWYAHLQKVLVTGGQVVQAGQQIGEVGALGDATGCHLHFEVHLNNGSIYGPDNVDPTPWLASHVSKTISKPGRLAHDAALRWTEAGQPDRAQLKRLH